MKSSSNAIPPGDLILIGKIAGVHGIRGGVKVVSYAEKPDIFEADRPFLVVDNQGNSRTLVVDWVKPHKRGLLIMFHDIADREAAEALVQAEICMKKADLPALEEDAYYWFELVGLSVFDAEGSFLGRIASIMETGSNDVYVVKDESRGKAYEVLIPALASVVRLVDLDKGIMTVNLPEGL